MVAAVVVLLLPLLPAADSAEGRAHLSGPTAPPLDPGPSQRRHGARHRAPTNAHCVGYEGKRDPELEFSVPKLGFLIPSHLKE